MLVIFRKFVAHNFSNVGNLTYTFTLMALCQTKLILMDNENAVKWLFSIITAKNSILTGLPTLIILCQTMLCQNTKIYFLPLNSGKSSLLIDLHSSLEYNPH